MSKKLVKPENSEVEIKADVFTGKVSLEKTRAIWNTKHKTYTDEELIRIREWMYAIAEVIIHTVRKSKTETKVIELNPNNHEPTQSNIIHPGEYRRAG